MHRIKPDRDYDVVVAVVEAPLIFVQQLPVHEPPVVEQSVRDRTAWQLPPVDAACSQLMIQADVVVTEQLKPMRRADIAASWQPEAAVQVQ